MNTYQPRGREAKIARFHAATGDIALDITNPINRMRLVKRLTLIREEFDELQDEAMAILNGFQHDVRPGPSLLKRFIKELADLEYVVSGTAVEFGIDLDGAVDAVHTSNMSKIDPLTEKPYERRDDGKVLKGPNYILADMSGVAYTGDDN